MFKKIVQRLFGRTVIDALGLKRNSWYIDEEQVTATAAQLNNPTTLAPLSVTPAKLGADVAGKGMLGGNGVPLYVDASKVHYLITPSVAPGNNISVPGMQVGDRLMMVINIKFTTTFLDVTDLFLAQDGALRNLSAASDGTYTLWVVWADIT
jgi:hypothetical protein